MKLLNHPHTSLVATSWNLGMDKLLHSTFYIIYMQIVGYILGCRSCLFVVHYIISLSSLCKLIWKHWTYEMPVRYILSSVWVRLSIFSQLSIIQYMGLCVFSLPISLVMIERIYTLSYYHHQLEVLSHMPLCISMISGVCVQGMWNAQVKGQVTETHRLKVNSHCDTALFISMYDITMVQP